MENQQKMRLVWVLVMLPPLYGMWLVLTGGRAWLYGLAVALAAAGASAWLAPESLPRLRPLLRIPALFRFAGFFLHRSLSGAVDVAWRALHPGMPLVPHWVDYPLRITGNGARALFIGVISLTPGTLSADLRCNTVRVHAIINDVEPGLDALERRVADVFGQSLERRS